MTWINYLLRVGSVVRRGKFDTPVRLIQHTHGHTELVFRTDELRVLPDSAARVVERYVDQDGLATFILFSRSYKSRVMLPRD